jgi:predicted  nucleic acid-binding Zn-ribbon protein
MCKINGHNLFTYLVQPQNAKKLYTSHERDNKMRAAQEEANKAIQDSVEGDETAKTANVAQQKKNKNQTLSSLRVESSKVGASVGAGTPVGLNLGG